MNSDLEKSDINDLQGKLFLAGMSRSGTNWLMRVLNGHPQITAFGESTFWGRDFKETSEDGYYESDQIKRIGNAAAKRYWAPGDGKPGTLASTQDGSLIQTIEHEFAAIPDDQRMTPFEVFQTLCQAVAKAERKIVAVEKTPHHVMWRDRIDTYCPDHRMVITIRDPYSFMLSYKHQGDRYTADIKRDFDRRYHPFGCAIVWRGYTRQIAESLQNRADRTLVIDFTDLQNNEDKVTRSIQEFFSLNYFPLAGKVPKSNSSFPTGNKPELQPEDIFWMNLMAKSEINRLGYGHRKAPFAPLRIGFSFISLVGWGVRNVLDMKKRVHGSLYKYLLRWIRGK